MKILHANVLVTAAVGLTLSASSRAQFDMTVNPLPIRDGQSHTVRIATPSASWLPGSNGKIVANGRLAVTLERRSNRKRHDYIKTFSLAKNGPTTAFRAVVPNWNSTDYKAIRARVQVTVKSNGSTRVVEVPVN